MIVNDRENAQRGITLSGFIVFCIIAIAIGSFALKVGPSYFEFYKIEKTFRAVATETSAATDKSKSRIKSDISKRFDVDQIKTLTVDDIEVAVTGGEVEITAEYEVCRPLAYNMRACMQFVASSLSPTQKAAR